MAQPSPALPQLRRPAWLVNFGRRLLIARGRAGLTQQGLAVPDLSKSFISLLESGRTFPSVETVIELAQRLNGSVAALLMDPQNLRLETALNLLELASQIDLAGRGTEAARLITAAEAVLPDMPVDMRIRATLLRARIAIAATQLDDAARLAGEAVAMARRQRRPNRLGMALALKGEVEVRRRTYRAALPILEEAASIMRRSREARTEENLRALISLGTTRWQLGQIGGARRAYQRVLDLATRLDLHVLRGKASSGLGLVAWTRRRLDAAADRFADAHRAFSQVEDLAEVGRALNNLGLIRREQNRLDESLLVLQQALRVQERLKDVRECSAILDEIAQVHLAQDRHADAARAARRAISEAQKGVDRVREAAAQTTLARILRAQGRRTEAVALFRGALSTFKRLGLKGRTAAVSTELDLALADAGGPGQPAVQPKGARSPRKAPKPRALQLVDRLPG
ncbi:MAG: tetratricopeptide repeat protein [bacterium]